MKNKIPAVIIASLLTIMVLFASTPQTTKAETSPTGNSPTVAVIAGSNPSDPVSLMQVQRMLEHKGLLYTVAEDLKQSALDVSKSNLIIVIGSTQPIIDSTEAATLKQAVETNAGLIWIGQGLPQSLFDTFGLNVQSEEDISGESMLIDYANQSTMLFNETISTAQSTGATVQGYFVDTANRLSTPAELSYRQGAGGLTYYFAYDVCSWWFADPQTPWLRAYRLHLAIENVLSEHSTARLAPYPNDKQAVFITRIEDVDPLHTSTEWLDRANNYLQYSTDKNAPLSVSLIPTYIDPQNNLNISLAASTAQALRTWLSNNLQLGGTIIQHGYTHQIGEEKTGMSPEFYNAETGEWLPLEIQKERIQIGKTEISQKLGFTPKGFESPHYVANQDTYAALTSLGFTYVTHNTNTPFADRQGLDGLINIPETLGYIPLNSSEDTENTIKVNMDTLYDMGAVMLVFNHLFDDTSLRIGKNLLDYATTKPNMWITNTDNLADFWQQRFSAYDNMEVKTDTGLLTITLGPSNRTGLTITLTNTTEIQNVNINGQPWPVFTKNAVILPTLPKTSNTITISLNTKPANPNLPYGLVLTAMTTTASLFFTVKTTKTRRLKHVQQEEEKT
jgi:hypothetical protein